jgi:hypothetical protein
VVAAVKRRHPNADKWLTPIEEAHLRRFTNRAFECRDDRESFGVAIDAIVDWCESTRPERLERHEAEGAR